MSPPDRDDSRQLAKGFLINLIGAFARISRFLYLIIFSRFLGSELFGLYALAFSVWEITSKFSVLGLEHGMQRYTGLLCAQNRTDEVRPTMKKILFLGVSCSALVAVGLYFSANWISILLIQKPTLAEPLRFFSFGLPALCTTSILVQSLRPTLDMRYEVSVRSVFEPFAVLVLGVIALLLGLGVAGLAIAHGVAAIGALGFGAYLFRRAFPQVQGSKVSMPWKYLLNTGFPMGGTELLNMFKMKIDLFVIGRFLPLSAVGIYAAIVEFGSALRKTRAAFDPILVPMVQILHERRKRIRVQANLVLAVRWVMIPALAFTGAICIAPDFFLRFFGENFQVGSAALAIFIIGQMFYVTLGLLEGILAITGFAYWILVHSVVLVVGNLALLFYLVPEWGIEGAALATTISFILITLARVVQGRFLLGIWPFGWTQTKPLLAFLISLSLGLLVARNLGSPAATAQLIGLIVFMAAYGTILLLAGIESSDRDVLRRLATKLPFLKRVRIPK